MAMTNQIRKAVSKKKRRFIEDGFNLDLTYISERVIAMGYPSENLESMYRNKLEDVRSLLEQKHKDHYKIYNLCSERSYDIQKFHNRVAIYPFDDHNPPEFGQMKPFCEDVDKWLDEHEQNVAVVHCKAGKGRTGLMICAYLLHRREYTTAEDVLGHYGSVRTQDQKGVTIPSQRRYVDYYAAMMRDNLQYNPVKMYLTSIVIDPMPQVASLGQHEGYIQFEVRQTSVRPFQSDVYLVKRTDGRINIELQNPLLIVGDVKIDFTQKIKLDMFNLTGRPRYVPNGKLFHFWVNTYFIDQHRSSHLTHDSTVPSAPRPTLTVPVAPYPEERNCRSTHNSGSGPENSNSPLPPPRKLGPSLSSDPRSGDTCPVQEPESGQETHSPNGSCLSSMQTIHSHPPARTVSIVDSSGHQNGRREEETGVCSDIKQMSISDDFLTKQAQVQASQELVTEDATHKSFMEKRHRHSSVPQTARAQGPNSSLLIRAKRHIPPGKLMSVRLNKSQIDKAAKDKSGKFSENFNVTLFLVRPNDQTLQAEFSRSNLICQSSSLMGDKKRFTVTRTTCSGPVLSESTETEVFEPGVEGMDLRIQETEGAEGNLDPCVQGHERRVDLSRSATAPHCNGVEPLAVESSEDSSEEETELRPGCVVRRDSQLSTPSLPSTGSTAAPLQVRVQSTVARTLTAPLPVHGMVRNSTEQGRLGVAMAVTSQSTWI